jgi:hypothetical protein
MPKNNIINKTHIEDTKYNDYKYKDNKYILINNKDREDTLFCNENLINKLKNLFKTGCEIPILLKGMNGIGKKHTIINLLHHIPYINNKIKFDMLKPLKNEDYENILHYQNFYLINFKMYSECNAGKLIKYLTELFSSKTISDKRLFLLTNINLLSKDNQKIFANIIEKYYNDNSFIMTYNKLIKSSKLISLCCQLKYPKVDENTFKEKLLNFLKKDNKKILYYEELYKSIKKYYKELYEVYSYNNYNIGYTLYHINQMIIEDKLIPNEIKKKSNRTSIYDKLATKTINKILKYKSNPKDTISNIRVDIYNYISLNIDEHEFIRKIIAILLNLKIKDEVKELIIKIGERFSRYNIEPDKSIVCVENFIINLIDILN